MPGALFMFQNALPVPEYFFGVETGTTVTTNR